MKVAFAGFRHGHIWGIYDSALEDSEITIAGCFEEDETARQEAEERIGKKFEFESYDEILADPEIDIVAIGDYYGKRGEMTIAALKSGKHVICDKPICTKLEELDEIEKLAKEKNLQVSCMLDLRYMPTTAKAKEIIESGVLGDIKIVSLTGQHILNYGKRPMWYFEEGKHGGTINDLAIHGVDLLRYILGKDVTNIDFAKTWNSFATQEPDFKDCAQFIADMDGTIVNADVSYSAPPYFKHPALWRFEFWGSKGLMTFYFFENKIHLYIDDEQIIDCPACKAEYWKDMLLEIRGDSTILNRDDILKSQRQVLEIQKFADSAN